MSDRHLELGKQGEKAARDFLESHNYRIVAYNFVAPIGHSGSGRVLRGEIDIIAYDLSEFPATLVFIEVKTRRSARLTAPETAVDLRKRRRIMRTARVYRRLMGVAGEPYRYDVISIIAPYDKPLEIRLLRNYFRDPPKLVTRR